MSRRLVLLVLLGAAVVSASPFASAASLRRLGPAATLSKLDTDHDGTLDLDEVKAAAQAKFASLDIDHDGTLDRHELGGLVTGAEFAAADKDNDKTIDETEYLAIVASAFQKADRDHDGTVSTAELSAPAGRKFLSLLAY